MRDRGLLGDRCEEPSIKNLIKEFETDYEQKSTKDHDIDSSSQFTVFAFCPPELGLQIDISTDNSIT